MLAAVLTAAGTHPALTRYRSGTYAVDATTERAHIRNVGISVLGPLTLDDSAPRLSPRETLVLAALAAAGDESLSADQLSEVVWGDTPPASWQKNLQTCVVRLRKALGPDAIETTGHGYRLALPVDAVDARQFEALATRGHQFLELGEADRAAYALGKALALWRGRPYTELEDWEPGSLEASRLSELRLDAQEWWLEASVRAGHHREILAQAQTLANAAPLRERRWDCWPWPSTAPAGRAKPCAPSPESAAAS